MEIQIELTQGKIALIDEADWDLVRGYRWYAQKGGSTYYAQATISREVFSPRRNASLSIDARK